ncbi:MAG: c-type cytochrome, partial [Verrucomicrobiota bacterium]|nr:c-type cytochrome [Verrucomicrobiota bacterium]
IITLLLFLVFICHSSAQDEVDAVVEGKKAFETYGCMVCHAVNETDKSVRSGPNLYSLFLKTPRDRKVLSSVSGIKVSVKADKTYYLN